MKDFNDFKLTEGIIDYMKPKSDEHILSLLNDKNDWKKFKIACTYGLLPLLKTILKNDDDDYIHELINLGIKISQRNNQSEITTFLEKYKKMTSDQKIKILSEGITDYMKPKDDEEVLNKLKGLSASEKTLAVKRYKLPEEYLPTEKEWDDEMYSTKASERRYKISRFKLSDKYQPTDKDWEEEMKDCSPYEKLDLISRFELDQKFRPSDEEITKELKEIEGFGQVMYVKRFNLPMNLLPDLNVAKEGIVNTIMKNWENVNKNDLKLKINLLYENGYTYQGVNEEADNRERDDRHKRDNIYWFKYTEPMHYISISNNTPYTELKNRIELYKKRYKL